MSYTFSKTLELSFQDAVARTREALTAEGFGIITEVDIQHVLKTKLSVDFRSYLILGACNPALAYEALKLEPNVGAMLPCNVVVQDVGGGRTEVSIIDPVASMLAINNPELKVKAGAVSEKLQAAMSRL